MFTPTMLGLMSNEQVERELDTVIDILQRRKPMPGWMSTGDALRDEQTLRAEIKRRGLR